MKLIITIAVLLTSLSSFACIENGCGSNYELASFIMNHTKLNGVNDERLVATLMDSKELTINQEKALIAIYFKTGSHNTDFQQRAIYLIIAQDNLSEIQAKLIEEIASNSQYYNGIEERSILPVLINRNIDERTANFISEMIRRPYIKGHSYTGLIISALRECPVL